MTAVSILFSTRNRGPRLSQTLESFAAIEFDEPWEIIAVDNGSTDETPAVLAAFSERLPLQILSEPLAGKNRALNRALKHARGSNLLFTDDDVIVGSDWLQQYLDTLQRWPDDAIFCGPIHPKFPDATPSWIDDTNFPYVAMAYSGLDQGDAEKPVDLAFGPNFLVRATAMKDYRYDETVGPAGVSYAMGSESELLSRMMSDGHRIIYCPAAPVQHIVREDQINHRWLNGRAFRFGRGKTRVKIDNAGPRGAVLFGVPRHYWPRLLLAGLQYGGSVFRDARARCVSGMKLYQLYGQVYEYRQLHKRQRSRAQ